MRVRVKTWRGEREMDLADALTPSVTGIGESGQVERAQDSANEALGAIGRLLAELVERDILSLDSAASICGEYGDIERVE